MSWEELCQPARSHNGMGCRGWWWGESPVIKGVKADSTGWQGGMMECVPQNITPMRYLGGGWGECSEVK